MPTFVHSKSTFVSLDAVDCSTWANNTDWENSADDHDLTMYGKNSKVFKGGLKDGKCTVSGKYDSTAGTGTRTAIKAKVGSNVTFIFRPEGTGTGKPQDSVDVLIKSYKETHAVADYIAWTAELQMSDDITSTTQA